VTRSVERFKTSDVRRVDPDIRHHPGSNHDGSAPGFDIPILLYHHLVPGEAVNPSAFEISIRQFEQQLDLLADLKFSVINFAALLRMMNGEEPRRERIAIITFDDAFRSFFEFAFPALKRRGLSATLFVPAGEIGGKNRWDTATGFPEREVMNENEVREVAAGGMEIGSHGWLHRCLPECTDAEAGEELHRSRDRLAALGLPPQVFAYPYGRHSPKHAAMVRDTGYEAAVSIFSGAPTVTADRFAMRRVYLHPGDSPWRFRLKLSSSYSRYKAFRERRTGPERVTA
jgi:peptidoglycan/xylan/chitin deacetylase (PgdA/CDA1 family)